MSDSTSISRRTALKGLGVAVGSAAIGVASSPPAESLLLPSGRCFVYLDHAARNLSNSSPGSQWVVGALLVGDPRLPRQILRRAKRKRLSAEELTMPEIKARLASSDFKRYFYRQLALGLKARRKGPVLLELYSIRASQAVLGASRGRLGLFQLRILQALLEGCDLGRFREVFVYHNLPSLRSVSEKAFRAGLLGARLRKGTRLKVWEHPPVWTNQETSGPVTLVDEGIQVADFATYAFYQRYQNGNARWYNMIRPRIRREINALGLLPSFLILR